MLKKKKKKKVLAAGLEELAAVWCHGWQTEAEEESRQITEVGPQTTQPCVPCQTAGSCCQAAKAIRYLKQTTGTSLAGSPQT